MKKAAMIVAAAGTLVGVGAASADFSGPYAPANWAFNAGPGGSGALNATTMVVTGGDTGTQGYTEYTTQAAAAGMVTCNFAYDSNDTGTYDSGYYVVNGAVTAVAFNNQAPYSAPLQFAVNQGDTFGFGVFTFDGAFGPGTATVTNFNGPVPAPGSLALLGLGGALVGRRRR